MRFMASEEVFDLFFAFAEGDGADGVDEDTADAQVATDVVENFALQNDERIDSFGGSGQFDFGMSAQYAESGAGGVDEYDIEWGERDASGQREIAGFNDEMLLGEEFLLVIPEAFEFVGVKIGAEKRESATGFVAGDFVEDMDGFAALTGACVPDVNFAAFGVP